MKTKWFTDHIHECRCRRVNAQRIMSTDGDDLRIRSNHLLHISGMNYCYFFLAKTVIEKRCLKNPQAKIRCNRPSLRSLNRRCKGGEVKLVRQYAFWRACGKSKKHAASVSAHHCLICSKYYHCGSFHSVTSCITAQCYIYPKNYYS